PRSRRHHRPHRRQQAAAGEHTAGHCRAHGRHPPVRGRDDEGGAGGRERKRSTAGRRHGSLAGPGGSRKLSRIPDGSALPQRVCGAGVHLAALCRPWAYHYLSGQPVAMLEQANEFLAFAEREDETGPIVVGYRLVGTSRLINGRIEEASDALHQALVRYDPDEHGAASPVGRSLRARFGQDVGVTMYSYRAWALWLSGQPADAEKAAESELERGRALGHDDQSRFYALWHAGMTYVLLRNVDKVAEIGDQLTELANDRQLPYWQ